MDTGKRLLSLDAFRGFDMMFIMGFSAIVTAVCGLFPGGADCWLANQMHHVPWHGLVQHDTIFPTFLFIAGISFPFSYAKQVDNGSSRGKIYAKIFRRGAILVLLGLVYNGLFKLDFANLRLYSVLARIGMAWMLAALLFINLKAVPRAVIAVCLLVGYWLLLRFVPVPGMEGVDPFSREGNLVGYIDRCIMPGRVKDFDPEGLLSLMPAVVTAMLGMFTGELVRISDEKISGNRKTVYMLAAAAAMLVVGLAWSRVFPINKALWTSTFTLVVGAYSLGLFAIFYWIIDVRGHRGWTFPFAVIGLNSITIYLAWKIIPFKTVSDFFLCGLERILPEQWAALVQATGAFALAWLFLYVLFEKRIFLKV